MEKIVTLKLNKEFKRAYYRGKFKAYPAIVTYIVKNNLPYNRVGITVSKKIGNAVVRNRSRRIIKAAYQRVVKEKLLPKGYDVVLVARAAIVGKKSDQIYGYLKNQIKFILTKR